MRLKIFGGALLAVAVLAQHGIAEAEEIGFYNWSEFIEPTVPESFTAEHGTKVRVEQYGEGNEAESRLAARGTGYDLAVVSAEAISRLAESGAIKKFRPSLAPNIGALDEELWRIFLDAIPEAGGYAIPYLWGTTGLVYDREKVAELLPDAPVDSWSLIFDPENAKKLAECGISMIDSNEEVVAITLAYLGKDPSSLEPVDLDAAFEVLSKIAPYIQTFDTDQYDYIADESICLSMTWSTEAMGPIIEDLTDRYDYVLPAEGANLWVDAFVMPVDTDNEEAAMRFLNHVIEPENLALSTAWGGAAISAPVTLELIDWDVYDQPALTLPPEVRKNLFVVPPRNSEQKRELDRRWRMMQIGM